MRFGKSIVSGFLAAGLTVASVNAAATAVPLDSLVAGSGDAGSIARVVKDGFSDYYSCALDGVTTTIASHFLFFKPDVGSYPVPVPASGPGERSTQADGFFGGSGSFGKGSPAPSGSGLSHFADYFGRVTGIRVPGEPQNRLSDPYAGTVSAVPLPAAAVLFGSALLGFVSFATRRRIS
jgi:hypothetical protein